MSEQPLDKDALQRQYDQLSPKYKQLEDSLKRDLKSRLQAADIEVLTIESRIKVFDSLWDKALRKRYDSPLDSMEDICGIRIICYYPSDVEPVCQVLENELEVKESVDKADLQAPQEFGYLSRHLIVALKEHWLETPSYKGLDGLRAEIQVRTLFQHAWAELSHELEYKNEEHVPRQFRRRLYQLSAILENLDDQFDVLHADKSAYGRVVSEKAEESGRFGTDQEVNIDSLQALLDFYFPTRHKDPTSASALLDDIAPIDISMQELVQGIEKATGILPAVLREQRARLLVAGWPTERIDSVFESQSAILRTSLELTNDDFVAALRRKLPRDVADAVLELTAKWKTKLASEGR